MSEERREGRKRFQNACDECRRRKSNSETMPDQVCSSCLTLNIQCVHSKPQQKRGPKLGSTRTVASHSVHVLVAAILQGTQSDPFDIPDDKEIVSKILVKLASRIKSLEKDLSACHRRLNSPSNSPSPNIVKSSVHSPSTDVESSDDDTDKVDNLSTALATRLNFPKKTHFGESSNPVSLIMAAMDHHKDIRSVIETWQTIFARVRRPRFWGNPDWAVLPVQPFPTFEFPDDTTLRKFVQLYFSEINIYFPALHRPSFERSIADKLHLRDPAFGSLVLVVCACGSAYAYPQNPRGDAKTTGWHWFSQIPFEKLIFSENVVLYHFQTYCLTIHYLKEVEVQMRPDLGWLLIGIAIRLAHTRGLHRRYENSRPTLEGELYKRMFWSIVAIDIGQAHFFGRPRATSSRDFDLDPIIECDDEYMDTANPDQMFKQPADKPSLVSFWASFLRLHQIEGLIQENIFCIKKPGLMSTPENEWYQQVVMELDSALNVWVDSVPPHLQWDKTNNWQSEVFFSQSAVLWSWYYFVQIQLHRRFIPRPWHVSNFPFPSLTICTNAARSIIRVVETHCQRRFLNFGFYLCVAIFNSAMILAINLWRGMITKSSHFDNQKGASEIHKCIDILRLYEPRYVHAGRMIDMINTVMAGIQCAPRFSPTPGPAGLTPSETLPTTYDTQPPVSLPSGVDTTSLPAIGSLTSEQHFNIPLHTSDLGGTNWFNSSPGNVHQAGSLHKLGATPGFNALDPQLAQGNTHVLDQGVENLQNEPVVVQTTYSTVNDNGTNLSSQSNNQHPVWPTNATEQDWDSFMSSVDHLFNIPHDPEVGNQSFNTSEIFEAFDLPKQYEIM
ncbi:hypothetical protein K435DRAFT_776856 [Dendrothele bispora CBS 962.96]|uniref:Xylanolytic transcriptional activator regulatory domain-containing protein n=1 Tax=Dendrothele bispora (strain CBS 962.96) TaxID=1314807 RepID=A0A4S8MBE3_DENBC|nr:hypothetical protein K435DRAFT_776856 [Dendrothele bispora CBS 962.96]